MASQKRNEKKPEIKQSWSDFFAGISIKQKELATVYNELSAQFPRDAAGRTVKESLTAEQINAMKNLRTRYCLELQTHTEAEQAVIRFLGVSTGIEVSYPNKPQDHWKKFTREQRESHAQEGLELDSLDSLSPKMKTE